MSESAYKKITDKIIDQLGQGHVPWHKPWSGFPANAITRRPYHGINLLLLAGLVGTYGSPYFLTFDQARKAGGHVKKGEHGTEIVYWQIMEKKTEDEDGNIVIKKFPYMKIHHVYNIKQCGNLEKLESKLAQEKENVKIFEPESVMSNYIKKGPSLQIEGFKACYIPSQDIIKMPHLNLFDGSKEYYSTLFHEAVHSTGHKSRLDRFEKNNKYFGSSEYSLEELVAELGASFLRHHTGIEDEKVFQNSVAYVENWLKVLKDDPKMIITASSKAQKAVDLILDDKYLEAAV